MLPITNGFYESINNPTALRKICQKAAFQFRIVPKRPNAVATGNHTKAHGIRPNWLSGIGHTVRLDLGTIQNRDIGIRHKSIVEHWNKAQFDLGTLE